MSKIADVLHVLGDGNWHRIEELRQSFVKTYEFDALVSFLGDFDFAVFDNAKLKIKAKSGFQDVLMKTG